MSRANQNLSDTAYIRYSDGGSAGGYVAYARSGGDGLTYTVGRDFDSKRDLAAKLRRMGYRKVVDTTKY